MKGGAMVTARRRNSMIKIGFLLVILLIFVSTPLIADVKVNINTADKEALTQLKNVGPVIADRIITYRSTKKFETPEEIMEVKGVGAKTFEQNKDLITVKDDE